MIISKPIRAAAFVAAFLFIPSLTALANPIHVQDDLGNKVALNSPAKRIITIAPNLTQMVNTVGAFNKVVAIDEKSSELSFAKTLPQIANFNHVDIEKTLFLKPDLILVTKSRGLLCDLKKLHQLNPKIAIYVSNLKKVNDIATTLRKIGMLTGKNRRADKKADRFLVKFAQLKAQYKTTTKPMKVFYELWGAPLTTLNSNNLIGEAISLCGGKNVFANSLANITEVDMETVIAKNPDVIVASNTNESWQKKWQKWPNISAVRNHKLITLNPHLLESYTPNVLTGIANLCKKMHQTNH